MTGGFETEVIHHGGEAILVVRGEIDAAIASRFADACAEIATGDRLILDFAAVTFMDSTGLRVLLDQSEAFDAIEVRYSPRNVQRLFELTGLAERFLVPGPPSDTD